MARIPHELVNVWGPRRDAVGRFVESVFAALAKGRVNAIMIVQIPSMKTLKKECLQTKRFC